MARAVDRENGAVAAELHRDGARQLAPDANRIMNRPERLRASVRLDAELPRVIDAWRQLLEIDVLLVHADDREAERNPRVMADRYTGTRGLAGDRKSTRLNSSHIPL